MFSKSIRVVYLYLVSFIFLMVGIFALVNTVNDVATLAFPQPTYCYDKYCEEGDCSYECEDENRNREIKGIITSVVTFAISSGLFFYHWTRIEKERDVNETGKVTA